MHALARFAKIGFLRCSKTHKKIIRMCMIELPEIHLTEKLKLYIIPA